MIYKCIKQYQDIMVGSIWESKPNHYMFKERNGFRYRYFTPFILKKFFKRGD